MPVDLYVIGAEHVVLHLLYARFFTKAFADMKLLKTREPFHKMRHIGLILGEDGQKMSKSRGNVVNPDEVVEVHGADSVRLFEMFMGPLQDMKPWSTDSIKGVRRFLDKVWRLSEGVKENAISHDYQQKLHQTIKKVTEDVENMHLNTAIAHMMTMVNVWQKSDAINRKDFEKFLKLLHPFAPHLTEELWHKLGNDGFLVEQSWPEYDEKLTKEEKFELVVQVNGKVREKHVVNSGLSDKELKEIALSGERVKLLLDNQEPKKVIVVKGKLVSIVL